MTGVLAGFNTVDVKVAIVFGSYHEVDSNEMAFKICGSMAIKEAVKACKPIILEPIMKVDVFTPEEHVGDVIGDLNRRRGMIQGQEAGSLGVRVKAEAPLGEMFGYIGDLRTMTSGRGQFSMEFSHYAPCPHNIADDVIKETNERRGVAA